MAEKNTVNEKPQGKMVTENMNKIFPILKRNITLYSGKYETLYPLHKGKFAENVF